MITIHFDGLCQPKNPGGIATYGFVVHEGRKRLHEECGLAAEPWTPGATNNVAEYTAVVKALEWAEGAGLARRPVVVYGDSDLVVKQLTGEYKVRAPNLVGLFTRARELAERFADVRFEWIPRARNAEADALTNRAYAEFLSKDHPVRRREDVSVRLSRGFSLEIDLPSAPSAAWERLGAASLWARLFGPGARLERRKEGAAKLDRDYRIADLAPHRFLRLESDEGIRLTLTLAPLTDGTLLRLDAGGFPATPEGEAAREASERAWQTAALTLQSAMEESA